MPPAFPKEAGIAKLKNLIQFGASPRASIYLTETAKALAFIRRRGYVTPEDVKTIGRDVLRHRIILTYEAEAEEMTSDDVISDDFQQCRRSLTARSACRTVPRFACRRSTS